MTIDLTKDECEAILASNRYAHLGCMNGDEPYVVPITYVYREGFLYGLTHEGLKIDLLRKHSKMCMQVEEVKSNLEWKSVACWGMLEELTEHQSVQDAILLFADQHGAAVLSHVEPPVSPMIEQLHVPHGMKPVVYRMQPYRITGKAERPA